MDRIRTDNLLPPKESKILRRAIKCYDQKNYKAGIRLCGQILSIKQFEGHPSVRCMQGLMFYFVGKKEEAIKSIKASLSADIKNPIAWHTYSTIHKCERNYVEAAKCLTHAIKYDPENVQTLTELLTLSIGNRDYSNIVYLSKTILKLKTGSFPNWMGYVLSLELAGISNLAISALTQFIETIVGGVDGNKIPPFQISKLLIFRVELLYIHGRCQVILDEASKLRSKIVDSVRLNELICLAALQLSQNRYALSVCMKLLNLNPENKLYYDWIFQSIGPHSCKVKILMLIRDKFPNAFQPNTLLLKYSHSESFKEVFTDFMSKHLTVRHPNIFPLVRSVYDDPIKVKIVEMVANGLYTQEARDLDSTWLLYFLAQHYYYLKNFTKCSELLSKLPQTFIDGLILKAKANQLQGDAQSSLEVFESAHQHDLADRNMDSMHCLYFMKYNDLDSAINLFKKYFTEKQCFWSGIKDGQIMWFYVGASRMFFRIGKYADALNMCRVSMNIFKRNASEIMEFHSYSMRKMLLTPHLTVIQHPEWHYANSNCFKIVRTLTRSFIANEHKVQTSGNSHMTEDEKFVFNEIKENKEATKQLIAESIYYLLHFEPTVKNTQIAFEFYYWTKKMFLMIKTLLKLNEIIPKDSKTFYYNTKFAFLYRVHEFQPLQKDILEPYISIIDQITSSQQNFSLCSDTFSNLYKYKTDIFQGKQFDKQMFLDIFDRTLSQYSGNWTTCNKIFKEFIHAEESLTNSGITDAIRSKMVQAFPRCAYGRAN
ncbi:N-alpha-acetyltransferase 15, NatA auxiliary subunit [Thelohanellus kitauei]|uniref:N-alpha-acetyltransferase 15, NatA auxiliary subunit n=1 Tax=Thelohanellus kitauei TaxID=669202 RepID=A0A0C2N400_THEKT|nr:N-alpha-acetyltransferase 15, NatA auxiliary subunit [Thelohanellus kitauei]